MYGSNGRSTNIKEGNSKEIVSDDWLIKGGEWYVEARADYDKNNDNGEILEENGLRLSDSGYEIERCK